MAHRGRLGLGRRRREGRRPYLLATLPRQEATGLRVVITGAEPPTVADVHALGPIGVGGPAGPPFRSGDVSSGRLRAAIRHPLARRLTAYSAGSVVAAVVGELAFVLTYGGLHAGTTWASAAGFVGAAVPNYILNRRWAWSDRRGRSRRAEVASTPLWP